MDLLELLKTQPAWIIVIGLVVYLVVKSIPNIVPHYFDKKSCQEQLKQVKEEFAKFKLEQEAKIKALEQEREQDRIKNLEMSEDYHKLFGVLFSMREKLASVGIGGIDELLKIKKNED